MIREGDNKTFAAQSHSLVSSGRVNTVGRLSSVVGGSRPQANKRVCLDHSHLLPYAFSPAIAKVGRGDSRCASGHETTVRHADGSVGGFGRMCTAIESEVLGKTGCLSSEMVGDAKHKEVGAVVCRDVAAVEGELGEVVLVLEEGGDRLGHIIADAG